MSSFYRSALGKKASAEKGAPGQDDGAGAACDDPPPAYTAAPEPGPSSGATTHGSGGGDNDPFAFLCNFDTVFLIDDSGSMAEPSFPGSQKSRWTEVADVLRAVVPICTARDADGIDIYFLNHQKPGRALPPSARAPGGYYGIRDPEQVTALFHEVGGPWGCTPTGERLDAILGSYMRVFESQRAAGGLIKPLNVIVITDGCPTDDPTGVLAHVARRLTDLGAPMSQLGVQFFQVGCDARAREALQSLDNCLADQPAAGYRDIVDASSWSHTRKQTLTADDILKVVLGAVVKRLDWTPMSGA
ncbi:hypothetical protein V2A60_002778 [Cordyceps javanica]